MSALSIVKDFYVKDQAAYEELKNDLERKLSHVHEVQSASLKKGREKPVSFSVIYLIDQAIDEF